MSIINKNYYIINWINHVLEANKARNIDEVYFLISTAAGIFNGKVDIIELYESSEELEDYIILKNAILVNGNNRFDLTETIIFLDEVISINTGTI